ncbi:MAG: hypothetical protein ACYDBB_26620 [Armatimonadota bacterium]
MRTHFFATACLAALLLLSALPGRAWDLWSSPYGNTEVLDQSQPVANTGGWGMMWPYAGVGQSFVPQASPLVRMDFMISGIDRRPFTIKLWKWNTDYATTTAAPPAFQDTILITGMGTYASLYSVFPNITVDVGQLYFMEFMSSDPSIKEEWCIGGASGTTDPYTAGQLRVNGYFRANADLYFKTYTTPQGTPTLPTFAASDPALPWSAPLAPGSVTTASDYYNLIYDYAVTHNVYNYYRNLPSDNANAIWSAAYAIFDAFLYQATSNEAYADKAIQLFETSYGYCYAHDVAAGGQSFDPMMAYIWISNSTHLTQTNRDHIKWLFVKKARGWYPNRAGGVENNAFGCALSCKLALVYASDLLTADEITNYTSYCDGRWNEFKANWDTDEDSNTYNWLTWQLLLHMAILYGEDNTIWSEPGFKALVDRYYEHATPLGPHASAGADYGWSNVWCAPTWLFEKAAAKYNDARYRWGAYRSFDYQRQHIKNVAPDDVWWATYGELACICRAYVDMNGNLATTQPVQGEVLAAKQDQAQNYAMWPISPTIPCGQQFKPTTSPLVRFDILVTRGSSDPTTTPGQITLWKWNTNYATTVAQTPLYRDTIDLTMPVDNYTLRSFYPFLDVEVGATYYVEFTRPLSNPFRQYYIRTFYDGVTDYYPDGSAYMAGYWYPTDDIWFRSYTLSKDGSTWDTRQSVNELLPSQRGTPPRWFSFGNDQVPDKLVLRSGRSDNDFSMVVNLGVAPYGHGHQEAGAILAITDAGSLLYSDGTYTDDNDRDHNMAITKRYWGGTNSGTVANRTTMDKFTDARKATVAWVGYSDLAGWDLMQQRRFFFVKNRFALLRDAMTPDSVMRAAFGTLWHAHDVHPTHDTNWYDIYAREPKGMNNWLFKNPERYLMLYQVPRTGYEMAEWKESSYTGNPPLPSYIIYQKFCGDTTAGQTLWADTVLLPHGSDLTPTQAAANISVLYRDDATGALAVKVIVGSETWVVVDNPTKATINITGLTTDAGYLITRTQTGMTNYVLTDQASRVYVDNGGGQVIDLTWLVRNTVELGG